jgi:thioesterase domain-containing protein
MHSLTVNDVLGSPTLGEMLDDIIRRSNRSVVDHVEISKISKALSSGSNLNDSGSLVEGCALTKLRNSHSNDSIICFPGLGWLGGEFSDVVEFSLGCNVFVAKQPHPGEELKSLVARVGQEIAGSKDGPLVLLGHSMGGLVASKVAQHIRENTGRCVDVVAIDTHRAVPLNSLNVQKTVDLLLGQSGTVPSTTLRRFASNAHLMNHWVERQQLTTSCRGAIVIEAGESTAQERRVKGAVHASFHVPRANHFTILKWPHVLNVVSVVKDLLGNQRKVS